MLKKMQVKLPKEYNEYLMTYGHGGLAGLEILGVGLTGRIIFVDTTLEYREEDLPNNLVVIENVDEWLMCLDCNTEEVVLWNFDGNIKEKDHLFHSTKRTGLGVGTQSVRRTAEKNDGSCDFTYENGVFTAKIMLRATP